MKLKNVQGQRNIITINVHEKTKPYTVKIDGGWSYSKHKRIGFLLVITIRGTRFVRRGEWKSAWDKLVVDLRNGKVYHDSWAEKTKDWLLIKEYTLAPGKEKDVLHVFPPDNSAKPIKFSGYWMEDFPNKEKDGMLSVGFHSDSKLEKTVNKKVTRTGEAIVC